MNPVVGGELRRQAVPRVGEPGAERDEDARRACGATQGERHDGERAEGPERDREPRAALVLRLPRRRGQREQRHAGGDRDHRGELPPPRPLAEPERRGGEHEDEPGAEQRLHERQGRARQRERLQPPAGEAEAGARDPAAPADEQPEERDAERVPLRRRPRLDRLQHDPDRVEPGGAQRGCDPDQDARHDRSR